MRMAPQDGLSGIFRYARFDVHTLCSMASELNAGLPCHCNCSRVPAAGSFNWAIPISFSDGSQWILRSSRNDISMSADHLQSLLASEVATLNYIRAHSTIPVPEIFAYR